jgi:DNA-binding winged helix-turn-helix (wHTH) protein
MRNNLGQKSARLIHRDVVDWGGKAMHAAERLFRELPGEDLATSAEPEVAGWISIYEELAAVLHSVLSRADGSPDADGLRGHLVWVEDRLAKWRNRHSELVGMVMDREARTITYAGRTVRLTRRESDLLDFMLRHPSRTFTTKQLAMGAWQSSRLSDAQVRTYIMRLRGRLSVIGLDHAIAVIRNRGYSLDGKFGGVAAG